MTAWLTDTLLYTGLLIALVLLARRPLGRLFGPQFAYALWALPALRLLLPPIELPASLAPHQAQLSDQTLLALAMAAQASPAPAPGSAPWWQSGDLWLALWLNGAVLFLAWRIASYLLMRRELLAEARTVGEAPGSRSGAGRPIRLVETPAVSSPVAFGVFDKVVALPQLFMAMEDRAARDLAIAHELAHHRAHDILANFAAQPLLALHWFNPLAWLGWRAMRRDQEAACDARVLAGRGREERATYAHLIAGFATGPRLALAAPMACPFIGEKSIIHRLRSLTMTDVSPARRRLGRCLLAGGALMLPLTASFSYAAAAQDSDVQPVPVAPSAAPQAPLPPEAPDAPLPPAAPEAPLPPDGVHGERHVQKFVLRHPEGRDGDKREQHMFVFRSDGPMSDAQKKQFEKMRKEWEKKGAEWRAHADEWRKLGEQQRQFALAHVPEVSTDCDNAGDGARSWTDDGGRQHVVICQRVIRDHAQMAQGQALMSLRMARNAVAGNSAISESVRQEVLRDLDQELARLQAEH